MKHYIPTVILFFATLTCSISAQPRINSDTEDWLKRLDKVVAQREQINAAKRIQLDEMRMKGSRITSTEELYQHNCQIYDACFTFDSELAMEVVDANLKIAQQNKDTDRCIEWTINRSFILASTGLLHEAAEAIEQIGSGDLSHALQLRYFDQKQYLYQHMSQYSWDKQLKEEYDHTQRFYSDSTYMILKDDDPDYLWFRAWRDMYVPEKYDEMLELLKEHVEKASLTTRDDAKLCYATARMYELHHETDLYIQYMCRSGIADLQSANQDIASLEELAARLYQHGDLARAYTYINVCLETARIYNNLVRTVSIAPVMDQILLSYQERDKAQRQKLYWLLAGLTAALAMLAIGISMLIRQRGKLRQQREKLRESNNLLSHSKAELAQANESLKEINQRLEQSIAQLNTANADLKEADLVKEEYIGYVFSLCSNYISKMDEYRKNINRKVKVKQYDEILKLTDKSTLVQDELKEFYQNFDTLFLNIYPTFIDDFNKLLAEEERIEPRKNGELLNTDLRIYALIRLGISDSVKIAEFLHCSPQTVYNNRLKIRNKTSLSKDDFMERIQKLGR